MTGTRIDDGRRRMPKSWCPYCHSRVVDSKTVELKNSIELLPLSSPLAEHYIICPKCRKTVGVVFKNLRVPTSVTKENMSVSATGSA